MDNEKDLLVKILELHKGHYIFTLEFWKNLDKVRKQLNYHSAILKEKTQSYKLPEEEEIKLIKQVLKEARERETITPEEDIELKRFKKALKENIRRKRSIWRNDLPNH